MKKLSSHEIENLQKICLKTEVDLADVAVFEPLVHCFGLENFWQQFELSVNKSAEKDHQMKMLRRNLFVIEMLKDELNRTCQVCGCDLKQKISRLGAVQISDKLPTVILLCDSDAKKFFADELQIISDTQYTQSGEVRDLLTPLFK